VDKLLANDIQLSLNVYELLSEVPLNDNFLLYFQETLFLTVFSSAYFTSRPDIVEGKLEVYLSLIVKSS
jgi:hypothetical protein